MAVFDPQHGDEGLPPDAHRVSLAGPIEKLRYPALCPHCGGAATEELPVTKVFRYAHDHAADSRPWMHRITEAKPLFCRDCMARHRAEEKRPTTGEVLKSVLLSEAAIPAYCMIAVAFFFLRDSSVLRDPVGQWPMAAVIAAFLLGAYACFRGAWAGNAHRRVAPQTAISRSFDFGDDRSSLFETVPRTYAIRDAACAQAFAAVNADLDAASLGPAQRRRERRNFWIGVAVLVVLALLGWCAKR